MVDLKLKLPDSFFHEEVRNGHLVTAKVKELWAVQIDLLCEFDRVCKKYDLKYILDFGTLLGAVRHKGFIPWDDDLDVSMLREDYDKLMEIGPTEFKHPYFLQNHETEPGYDCSVVKLRRTDTTFIMSENTKHRTKYNQGIFIDIFVFDNIPTDDKEFVLKINQESYNAYLSMYVMLHFPSLKDGYKFPLVLIRYIYYKLRYKSPTRAYQRLLAIANRYGPSEFVANIMFMDTKCRLKRLYKETKDILFEGLYFPAPVEYDVLLHERYGDYMTPVKGTEVHQMVFFDTDRPYLDYMK